MIEKLVDLKSAAALVESGMTVSVGGSLMHRSPLALVREAVRAGVRDLTVVAAAGALGVDLLCASGAAKRVIAGYAGLEGEFGLAPGFRKSVAEGRVIFAENS